jgi:uncharacterized protein
MRFAPANAVIPRESRKSRTPRLHRIPPPSLEHRIARASGAMTAVLRGAIIVFALLLGGSFSASADVAVPQLTGRVVDQTGTLSSSDIAALSQKLRDFEARKGSQIAVLIVPTTQPETIEQFSIRVAEAWKIGRKKVDDGAILVVAKNDRHLRIEVGYGLEGALTDVTSRRIIDEDVTPKFRSGDFAAGIEAGVDRMIRVIDGEPLPAPSRSVSFGSWHDIEPLFYFVLFGPLVVGGFLRAMFGRLLGSVVAGAIVGVLAWFVLDSAVIGLGVGVLGAILTFIADLFGIGAGTGSSRGGAWSGGSSSGGWSSGSSSSGGFSGGGGSFGGGGASGSW